jgi:hypothetical protein
MYRIKSCSEDNKCLHKGQQKLCITSVIINFKTYKKPKRGIVKLKQSIKKQLVVKKITDKYILHLHIYCTFVSGFYLKNEVFAR